MGSLARRNCQIPRHKTDIRGLRVHGLFVDASSRRKRSKPTRLDFVFTRTRGIVFLGPRWKKSLPPPPPPAPDAVAWHGLAVSRSHAVTKLTRNRNSRISAVFTEQPASPRASYNNGRLAREIESPEKLGERDAAGRTDRNRSSDEEVRTREPRGRGSEREGAQRRGRGRGERKRRTRRDVYGSGALLVVSVCVALEAGRGRRPPPRLFPPRLGHPRH